MAEETNFDASELDDFGASPGGEIDAGASLQSEEQNNRHEGSGSSQVNDSLGQPRQSPAAHDANENEEYTPRELALIKRLEQVTGQSYDGQRIQSSNVPTFEPQEHNFLDGLDIDDVLSSSENLNKLLLAVYNRGLQESLRMAGESWNTSAPALVRDNINQHMTMRELVDNFYADNPDLAHVRRTVGAIANEVSQENSELTIEQVFAEAAKRTREALGLPTQSANGNTQRTVERPNLPQRRSPGNRRNGPGQLTGITKEIDDLISGVI